MKKYLIGLGVVAAAVALIFVNVDRAVSSVDSSLKGAVFSWEKMAHDFGQIEQNKPVTATFAFENTGDTPLLIVSTKGSCGCTVSEYTKGEILPGSYGEVTATYNAKKVGAFTKTVTVNANTADGPITLRIKGEVTP